MGELQQSDAKAVIEAVERLAEPTQIALDEGTDLIVAQGGKVIDLKPYRDARLDHPERRIGTAHLTDLESFIAHVNRFKGASSAVFADITPTAPKLVAVLDYHDEGFGGQPRFGKHRDGPLHRAVDEPIAEAREDRVRVAGAEHRDADREAAGHRDLASVLLRELVLLVEGQGGLARREVLRLRDVHLRAHRELARERAQRASVAKRALGFARRALRRAEIELVELRLDARAQRARSVPVQPRVTHAGPPMEA